MTFTSVMLTILWLIVIPVLVGSFFSLRSKGFIAEGCLSLSRGLRQAGIFIWSWFLGQLLLWCVFQMLTVWIILHENRFASVVKYYSICVALICAAAIIVNLIREVRKHTITGLLGKTKYVEKADLCAAEDEAEEHKRNRDIVIFAWAVFFVILAVQIVLQVVLAYMDADDSYYISEAVAIESSNNMYKLIPYTGMTTAMDYRHSLEPFPAWLAFISKITGIKVVTMAHILMPAVFLPLTYGVYALMGNRVLGKKKTWLPIYMVITEILVMFCLYSSKIPEKFFITRIRQGKSAITSLIIPGLILCLFMILEYARDKRRTDFAVWVMLFMLSTAGCLCSTLGALLCVIPVAIVAVMMIFAYKKGWHLIPMIIGCLPCFLFALLYVLNS